MIHLGSWLLLPVSMLAMIACNNYHNESPTVITFVSAWTANRQNSHHAPFYTTLPMPSSFDSSPQSTKSRRSLLSLSSNPASDNEKATTSATKQQNTNNRNKNNNTNRNKNTVRGETQKSSNPKNQKGASKNKSKKGGSKNKSKNKSNSKRKGQGGNNNNNNNNNNRRQQTKKGSDPNRKNSTTNRNNNKSSPPRSFSNATTVSELVQNLRSILGTSGGPNPRTGDWRTAWSILKREAVIPVHAAAELEVVDAASTEQHHTTILPVRMYYEVLGGMKRERNCWRDAIRLVQYMERGNPTGDPDENKNVAVVTDGSETAAVVVDKYNSRPWHIPSPNYEIYYFLLDCIATNGGGRKDAHDAMVFWLSKMLRKLEDDIQQQQSDGNDNDNESTKGDAPTITNRDRKLVRNSIQLVLSSLSKQRSWREALQLLNYHEVLSNPSKANIPLTIVQYNTVLTCLSRSRQVGQCQRLLQRLRQNKTLRPDEISYNAVVGVCASAGRWKEALTVLDECYTEPNVEPNIYIYTNAIRACAKGGNTPKALALLEVIKDKGLPVDSYCYTAVIDACAKGKQWKKALELFDEMESKGIEPTQVTYSVTISALGNGLQWERALWLLNLMRDKGLEVNLITYNAAITALAKSSWNKHSAKLSRSSTLATDSEDYDVDHVAPNGDNDEELWSKALDLLRQMDEDGIEPDGFCYSSAINCCGAEGRWKEACQLIIAMKRGGPKSRPNKVAYTAAITACGRAGQGRMAFKLFQNMRDDGLAADRVAYNALFSALRVSNDAAQAYELWGEICGRRRNGSSETASIATARDVASPDIITLTDCIATLSRAGHIAQMDEVFKEAVERGIVLGRDNNDLDEQWEIDLSGLPFPIARAATRYLLKNIVDQKHKGTEDTTKHENDHLQDMIFITGIGTTRQKRKEEKVAPPQVAKATTTTEAVISKNVLDRKDRTISLQDFVRGILETDFDPPLESIVPELAQGTVVIEEDKLARWLNEENGSIVTAESPPFQSE